MSDKYVVLGGSGCSQDENRRLWNVSIYHRINTNHYYCSILNVSSCAVPSFKTDPLLLWSTYWRCSCFKLSNLRVRGVKSRHKQCTVKLSVHISTTSLKNSQWLMLNCVNVYPSSKSTSSSVRFEICGRATVSASIGQWKITSKFQVIG